MSIELKPCPFCGGAAAIEFEHHTFHGSEVRCQSCSAASGHYEDDKESVEASAAWNRRSDANLAAAQQEIARLRAALEQVRLDLKCGATGHGLAAVEEALK